MDSQQKSNEETSGHSKIYGEIHVRSNKKRSKMKYIDIIERINRLRQSIEYINRRNDKRQTVEILNWISREQMNELRNCAWVMLRRDATEKIDSIWRDLYSEVDWQ